MNIPTKKLRLLACSTRIHCAACRTDSDWLKGVIGVREFECPHGVEIIDGQVSEPQDTSRTTQGLNILKAAGHAAKSVAKTSIGIDRATDEQVKARLDVCTSCPGNHSVFKDGKLHTCGSMLESMKKRGEGTCGCVLVKKARDLKEDCPFGWWPAT